ncbi:hypothetical protein AB0L05_22245 [Nonomuraea pusilla]|uniref:hypothetical protein n=1 Tax=Nonomuraea pusilla TaxID=46177 RepID=UPI00332F35D7
MRDLTASVRLLGPPRPSGLSRRLRLLEPDGLTRQLRLVEPDGLRRRLRLVGPDGLARLDGLVLREDHSSRGGLNGPAGPYRLERLNRLERPCAFPRPFIRLAGKVLAEGTATTAERPRRALTQRIRRDATHPTVPRTVTHCGGG